MKRVRVNILKGNFRPVLGKLVGSAFEKKRNDSLHITQCSCQALRYSIVYVAENCQTVIIFNNLGI